MKMNMQSPPPTSPRPASPVSRPLYSISQVKTPPSPTTEEEDFDVIEVVKHIDVIVIEDDDDVDCKVEETATISSNVLSRPEKEQPAFLNSGSRPGSSTEPFLRISPSTPSSDVEDPNLFKLKNEEVALNLKSLQILSAVPAAMAVIPSPERKEENLEINSPKEDLMKSRLALKEPIPTHSADGVPSASYFELTSNLKLSPPHSTIKELRSLSSSSTISTNQNSFCYRSAEEDPFEGPSSLLDDDSRSTLVLSSTDLTEDAELTKTCCTTSTSPMLELPSAHPTEKTPLNVLSEILSNNDYSPNLILSSANSTAKVSRNLGTLSTHLTVTSLSMKLPLTHLTEHMSSTNETSAMLNISTMPSEEESCIPQSSFPPALSTEETFSTLPTLKTLSTNKKSIFDCPKTYQFYYQNSSPEIRHYLDEICMKRQEIISILDKYSNDDVTKLKADRINGTLNVKNSETGKIDRQNSEVSVRTKKPDKTDLNNLKEKQKRIIKQKNGTVLNEEFIAKTQNNLKRCRTEIYMTKKLDQEKSQKRLTKTYEVELDSFRYRNLQNTSNIDNERDVHPEMLNQSNVTITPKQTSLLKNTISKEKKRVKSETKVREIHSENNNSNEIQQNENKYKRKLSSNQYTKDKININDNFPTTKKQKSDCLPETGANSEQNHTIVANTNPANNMDSQPKATKPRSSSKRNKQVSPEKKNQIRKRSKRKKEAEPIDMIAAGSQNDARKHSESYTPSYSKHQREKLKKKISTNTIIPDSVERHFHVVSKPHDPESQLKISLQGDCPVHCSCDKHRSREHYKAHETYPICLI